ncbi:MULTISPECIES: hypothetical protein [unclassified Pseudoalteromonas]|uniref:hypothetical protein n=1 Tax=unclassified Pseudoalteromonas TaxID=194690 RepID=UPI002096FCF0|nr:hypothetical protein [Pseudoalteromonas sp. XMcav2-N]MCO7189759.1 hypothetical protein [Pseudoalteromonas sp. XMcav2-N]
MNKEPYTSPITEYTDEDDRQQGLANTLGIGLLMIILSLFLLDLPDKTSLREVSGQLGEPYLSSTACGKAKCYFIKINTGSTQMVLHKKTNAPLKPGDNVQLLVKYRADISAYTVYEVSRGEVTLKSYSRFVLENNLWRLFLFIAGLGLCAIAFALRKKPDY